MPWFFPFLIFFARICDVSLGTLRIIFIVRGKTVIAALLGFLEVSIWVLAISGTLKFLANPLVLISYAGGFACGIILGLWLESRLVPHFHTVRAINVNPELDLAAQLRNKGYPVTELEGKGKQGTAQVCFIIMAKDSVGKLEKDILEYAPGTFITVEDLLEMWGGVKKDMYSKTPAWLKVRKCI